MQATLYLRAVCEITDDNTFAPIRYGRGRPTGASYGTPTRYVPAPGFRATFSGVYGGQPATPTGDPAEELPIVSVTDNRAQLDPQLDHILNGIEKKYDSPNPQIVTYAGIRLVEMDGAIQNLDFQVGHGGCKTTISRNTESLESIQSYEERRLIEKLKEAHKTANVAAKMLGRDRHQGKL